MDTNLGKIPMEKVCVREGTWCEYVKERDFIRMARAEVYYIKKNPLV